MCPKLNLYVPSTTLHLTAVELWFEAEVGGDFVPQKAFGNMGNQAEWSQFEGNDWCLVGAGRKAALTKGHSLTQSVDSTDIEDPRFKVILVYFVPSVGIPKDVTGARRERGTVP